MSALLQFSVRMPARLLVHHRELHVVQVLWDARGVDIDDAKARRYSENQQAKEADLHREDGPRSAFFSEKWSKIQ